MPDVMRRRQAIGRVADARVLADGDVADALALCARDPVAAVLAASRLVAAQLVGLRRSGGQVWGFPADGPLEAICWSGANLVPVVGPGISPDRLAQAVAAFAAMAQRYARRSASIVGECGPVLGMWSHLRDHWPQPRDVRPNQPSMVIDRSPALAGDPGVRRAAPEEFDLVLPACVAMFTEEVGYSPVSGGRHYEERVRSLISSGRSLVRMSGGAGWPPADGPPGGRKHIVFKAEIGATAGRVAQAQGVWVAPAYRGRGLAAPGMARVVELTRAAIAPVVSLYVNDFNTRAIAAYRRVGFRQVGTYATVLF